MKTDKYLGLDVHKDTTVIAIAEGGRDGDGAQEREDGAARSSGEG